MQLQRPALLCVHRRDGGSGGVGVVADEQNSTTSATDSDRGVDGGRWYVCHRDNDLAVKCIHNGVADPPDLAYPTYEHVSQPLHPGHLHLVSHDPFNVEHQSLHTAIGGLTIGGSAGSALQPAVLGRFMQKSAADIPSWHAKQEAISAAQHTVG